MLRAKAAKRGEYLTELETARRKRQEQVQSEKATLGAAIKSRGIAMKSTSNPPDMEDAAPALADPSDPKSILSLPLIFLYPLTAQSDFVKSFKEDETLAEHLSYILPPPWDEKQVYTANEVECYMETTAGGLIKAGKKLKLLKLLEGGKVAVIDGLVKVNIVLKDEATKWIEVFKDRRGKQ